MLAWATLLVTLFGIAIGLTTVWWQLRRQWLLHSASLITQLVDRFESEEWCRHRQRCAELLRRHHAGEQELDLSAAFPVLPFLENIAHLTRRGALDKLMVWNKFGWSVVGYYFALTTRSNTLQAARDRAMEPTNWEEFEWLYREAVKIYRQKGSAVDDPRKRELKIQEFLAWEGTLGT